MYYAISGPASSGKSTLLEALREPVTRFAAGRGLEPVFIQERAREIFHAEYSRRYATFADMLADAGMEYQYRLAEVFAQDVRDHAGRLVIADRSGLDVMVYTILLLIQSGYRSVPAGIFELLQGSMSAVRRTFMTSSLGSIENDGFRPPLFAEKKVREVEESLFRALGSTIQNITWLPSSISERVDVIMTSLHNDIP